MRTWTEGIWLFLPHPDQTGPLSGPAAPPGLRVAPSQAKRSPCTPTFRPSAGIDEVIACAESRLRSANRTLAPSRIPRAYGSTLLCRTGTASRFPEKRQPLGLGIDPLPFAPHEIGTAIADWTDLTSCRIRE